MSKSEQQEQAGEPKVGTGGYASDRNPPVISMQLHLETMESYRKRVKEVGRKSVHVIGKLCDERKNLREAVAKKDAALKACVEALEATGIKWPQVVAAIKQAQESL